MGDNTEGLLTLIEQHRNRRDWFFGGPVPESRILAAERILGVRFPTSYRRFLATFGSGNLAGKEFYGITPDDGPGVPNGIWFTLTERVNDLPQPLVVVMDADDGLFCIDTSRVSENGEAPVVCWQPVSPSGHEQLESVAPDFSSFAIAQLRRGLDLWRRVRGE